MGFALILTTRRPMMAFPGVVPSPTIQKKMKYSGANNRAKVKEALATRMQKLVPLCSRHLLHAIRHLKIQDA